MLSCDGKHCKAEAQLNCTLVCLYAPLSLVFFYYNSGIFLVFSIVLMFSVHVTQCPFAFNTVYHEEVSLYCTDGKALSHHGSVSTQVDWPVLFTLGLFHCHTLFCDCSPGLLLCYLCYCSSGALDGITAYSYRNCFCCQHLTSQMN